MRKENVMIVTLLIPTFNELEGMKQIMPRVDPTWVDEILVVDAGTDGTYEYAQAQGYTVIKQKGRGLYRAYREAVAVARGNVLISFSPDGNSVPELIPRLVEEMRQGYDMVIASRYLPGAKSEDDDRVTAFGNWMFTQMINRAFSGNYTDSLVMFRAWKKELFKFLPNDVGRAGVEPNLAIQCAKRKLRVKEIPGDEPLRVGSPRKMNPLLNGWAVLKLIAQEWARK